MSPLAFTIAHTLTKIFLRDRQTIILSLLFPVIFMVVFGFVGNQDQACLLYTNQSPRD